MSVIVGKREMEVCHRQLICTCRMCRTEQKQKTSDKSDSDVMTGVKMGNDSLKMSYLC